LSIDLRPTTNVTFGKISNGHNYKTGHPIYFVFGSLAVFEDGRLKGATCRLIKSKMHISNSPSNLLTIISH